MILIRSLEYHVHNACNLACSSCTHFSNLGLKGSSTPEELDAELSNWSSRLRPGRFALLGGEPTLNPRLSEFLDVSRRHFNTIPMLLVTNGFLLHKHDPSLPESLERNRIRLSISIHHAGPTYRQKENEIRALVDDWQSHYKLMVDYRPSARKWRNWFKRTPMKLEGGGFSSKPEEILPADEGKPERSWANCVQKNCHQLFRGKLWKCPHVTYVRQMDEQFGIDKVAWREALDYEGIGPESTDMQVEAFFAHRAIPACSTCPTGNKFFDLRSPIHGVDE